MKNLLLVFLLAFASSVFAQCINADPFCTGTTYNFPNSTNVSDLGAVDCLGSTPNPSWYYMQIDQAGSMTFNISQTNSSGTGIDVDFALWGPYNSLSSACANANPFPSSSALDCSYSTAAQETATIPNAQPGEVYVLLITNYANQAGNIDFSQTGGSGSASCQFTCGVNLTATPSACSNNTYTLSGNLTVTAGPGISVPNTGTVTIQNTCGGSQTFNAPFTNIPYSFPNLTANGASCDVTATFSNFPNCNAITTYTAPQLCNTTTTCSVTSVTATPSAATAGVYSVNGAVSFTNPPSTGTLTVSGCGGTQTFNAPFTSPTNYSFTNLTANGASCTVTASFSATTCSGTTTYTAPTSSSCSISSVTATPSTSTNNVYSVNGNITFTNPPSNGTLTVSGCGGTQIFNAPFTSPQAYSFTNLTSNGASCTVTASFSATPSCTNSTTYTAPAPNTVPCVSDPFCTGTNYTFPAGTNQTAASTTYPNNNYSCLGSSPNPAWYWMQIDTPGSLGINMSNSAGVDIDFILYGPYTSYNSMLTYCDNMGTATSGSTINTVVDCSFSSSATETANIANAQTGEVYVLLITNFSNSATNINFSGSGTATTDCTIVTPVCTFTNFTGSPSACNPTNNQYSVSGTVTFTDPPTTGTLTISGCGGTQTFNAPFGTSVNYNITGLQSTGTSCTLTAVFSADAACTSTFTYNAPVNCTCNAHIGTYVTSFSGKSTTNGILCYNDQVTITSNNNWTPPAEIVGATTPGSTTYDPNAPTYDPGIAWLVYRCPPSVAVTPAQASASGLTINDDPCLVGVVGNTPNLTDVNDLSLINSAPAGTFTNNTVYLVPITMYSLQDGIYSYVVLPAQDCYELGTPVVVQYLNDITTTQTSNCANGTASVTINGGSPQFNGGNYTVVAGSLTPNTASFVNSSTGNGGTIIIGNLTTGPYSFQIKDANGCPKTISGNYVGPETANLTYPESVYCLTDQNPVPTMVGTPGGTYTSGIGLSLNSTTGVINLPTTTPGAYTVTYTTPGPLCPTTSSFNITIAPTPIVDAGEDITICKGKPIILNGSGADVYVWNYALQNGVPYLPNLGQTEFIVMGTTVEGCFGFDSLLVNVVDDCETPDETVFWVPNSFTPDGDQYNQTFEPVFYSGYDPYHYELYIYNRWGELIAESHDVTVGWDGTYYDGMKCPDGVYTWKIRFKLLYNDEKRTVVGHVTLIK